MINAIFKPLDTEVYTNPAKQWDYGQILRIQGVTLPKAVEVHFGISGEENTVPSVGVTDGDHTDIEIPDGLLRQPNDLVAYVYIADVEKGNTVKTINIPVIARAKPAIPHTPEDEAVFREAIEAVNTAADRAEKAGQTATEAAGQAAEDAQQTAEDRKEVEKMVETVSDISEQVKKVEQLSQQAQDAATKAGKSEQAADGFKTQAESAKKDAEAAAVKTAEDKTAVENAKTEVLEVKTEVNADRTVVEQIKNEVEQLGGSIAGAVQSGVQEITQAGTAQKTAVEGAGTQAVESVDNAKTTATEAVEIAKTEAVQAVQAEGTTQTGNVTTEGTKQVKAVQDKGNEVLQSIPEDFTTQMETKLNKQQGIENKGKALVIGEDGNVAPGEVQSGGGDGIAIINTMSGESPLAIPDSAERVNKRLELGGKTEQVSTRGVNLWNKESKITFTATKQVVFDTPIPAGDYVVSANVTSNDKDGAVCLMLFYYTDSGSKGANLTRAGRVSAKITFTSDVKHVVLYAGSNANASANDTATFADIQLEKGSTATAYEPYTGGKPSPSQEYEQEVKNAGKWNEGTQKYEVDVKVTNAEQNWSKEQTLTLTSDRPITKWDRLVEQGGQIGWLYAGVVIDRFDGQSNKISIANKQGNVQNFSIRFENVANGNGNSDIFVDKYRAVQLSYTKAEYGICCNWNDGVKYFSAPNENVATVDEFKAWLIENPLKIAYETTNPEFIPLPQSEQNAIRALKTYYPTTVITVDGGELDPDIKVTYTADTKNYIDNKVSAKVASIIRQYRLNTANLLSLMPMETQAAMIENDTNNILENAEEMKHE